MISENRYLKNENYSGCIVFDHDGTLVNTSSHPFSSFGGITELLVELKALNFELFVWTARSRRSTVESLKRANIISFFTELYCFDDGIPKPHTMGLEKLTSSYSKDLVLHIGDSLSDIEGAREYGIEVIAACWNNPNQVENYLKLADYTAETISECRDIIKRKFYV